MARTPFLRDLRHHAPSKKKSPLLSPTPPTDRKRSFRPTARRNARRGLLGLAKAWGGSQRSGLCRRHDGAHQAQPGGNEPGRRATKLRSLPKPSPAPASPPRALLLGRVGPRSHRFHPDVHLLFGLVVKVEGYKMILVFF